MFLDMKIIKEYSYAHMPKIKLRCIRDEKFLFLDFNYKFPS